MHHLGESNEVQSIRLTLIIHNVYTFWLLLHQVLPVTTYNVTRLSRALA